ncbi:MAG: hypothetical protein AAGA09_02100 [Pseudomonadota bacterium]
MTQTSNRRYRDIDTPVRRSQKVNAAYIEDLVGQLEALAKREDMSRLADLLRLAREEARGVAFSHTS